MTDYRRARVAGGTWFFTVGLAERRGADLLVARIDALEEAAGAASFPHGCRGGIAGPPASRLVLAGRRLRLLDALGLDQGHVLAGHQAR